MGPDASPTGPAREIYPYVKYGLMAIFGLAVLVALLGGQDPADTTGAPTQPTVPLGDPEPLGPTDAVTALDEGDHVLLGAWLGDWPTEQNELIASYEEATGTELELVDVFVDPRSPFGHVEPTLVHIVEQGAVPVISWEPHGFTTPQIVSGTREVELRDGRTLTIGETIDEFGSELCAFTERARQPVLVRPMHEMNGHWYTWGQSWARPDGVMPNTDARYQDAWQRIHQAFRSDCTADQVRFIWAVNHYSVGPGATLMGTYPGDAYVDYVGIDGYNWGEHAQWGWQSFDEIFKPVYCTVTRESPRPVIIAEWASAEQGGNKAAWLREALSSVAEGNYPRVRAMVYFDVDKEEVEVGNQVAWGLTRDPEASRVYAGIGPTLQGAGARDWSPAAGTRC